MVIIWHIHVKGAYPFIHETEECNTSIMLVKEGLNSINLNLE